MVSYFVMPMYYILKRRITTPRFGYVRIDSEEKARVLSALLFGLPALVAAIFLGPKRFYLYAFLAVGLPAAGAWLNVEPYIPMLTMGVIAVAFGTVLLVNFLQKYPLNAEVEDVNG